MLVYDTVVLKIINAFNNLHYVVLLSICRELGYIYRNLRQLVTIFMLF